MARINVIEYVTIASVGNATDFGDLTAVRSEVSGCSSSVRGLIGGGVRDGGGSATLNIIEYITIATTGNSTDFGDLTLARDQTAAASSSTRGIFSGGGATRRNTIDYVTIASTGNATDFGDLAQSKDSHAGTSSSTRAVFGGGHDGTSEGINVIEYVTIASVGNAADFGDLTAVRQLPAATSNGHGGVQ